MRRGFVVPLLALLSVDAPAFGCDFYTLPGDLPFELTIPANGSVVRGTFHRVSQTELDSWDLSTGGQDANAPPGTHACADLGFNPFAYCPFSSNPPSCDADAVVFRLSLDGDSGPVSQTGPTFNPFVQTAHGGSAYIISANTADRVPVSSSTGTFQFHTSNDPAVFIQPGEQTVWLLSRYEAGAIATALSQGVSVHMSLRDDSPSAGIGFVDMEIQIVPVSGVTTTTLPPGGGACGDPIDPPANWNGRPLAVTASDALFTLQVAVGAAVCDLCVCDVNDSGGVTASDALLMLQSAVGQPVALTCPACQ